MCGQRHAPVCRLGVGTTDSRATGSNRVQRGPLLTRAEHSAGLRGWSKNPDGSFSMWLGISPQLQSHIPWARERLQRERRSRPEVFGSGVSSSRSRWMCPRTFPDRHGVDDHGQRRDAESHGSLWPVWGRWQHHLRQSRKPPRSISTSRPTKRRRWPTPCRAHGVAGKAAGGDARHATMATRSSMIARRRTMDHTSPSRRR